MKRTQQGFTLIELMIYTGLTAMIIGLFAGILITTTRIQGQQSSSAQVTQELNFLMTTLERYVHSATDFTVSAGHLGITIDQSTTKSIDLITGNHKILVTENSQSGSTATFLSSSKILIDNLTFTALQDGNSKAVQIVITASANTTNPQQMVTRVLESTAALLVQEQ